MSLPNIPDILPDIDLSREDVRNLLLAAIAMEEIALSHILNVEGEKIQKILETKPNFEQLLEMNRSLERTLRNIIKQQMLLNFKLEDILEMKWSDQKEDLEADLEEELEEDFEDDLEDDLSDDLSDSMFE